VNPFLERNRLAWDERVARGQFHTEMARECDFVEPLAAIDPLGWLGGSVHGRRVLCLAAGGGKHGVLLAAAGAHVTVVDLSPRMLELDRRAAAERGLNVRLVETSMEDLSMFSDASFDAVIQPVSTCYVPEVGPVYREIARVTAAGGIYFSQHKQPASLQAEARASGQGYLIQEPYCRAGPLPVAPEGLLHREAGTVEFLHRWQDLLGGLCRAGFVIEDLLEPWHGQVNATPGSFQHRSAFLPPFVTIKARRNALGTIDTPKIWVPG